MLKEYIYPALKEKTAEFARRIGPPSFYARYREEMAISEASLQENELLKKCRSYIDESQLHHAHGMAHGEKVAVEAGAILLIECAARGCAGADGLMLCAQVAGLLHDIKRREDDHTVKGAEEVERILRNFDMDDAFKKYITAAIRNHEAFKEVLASEDRQARLVSDALYDADKFRWGPDNFTTTLWLILEHAKMPAEELLRVFRTKMEGIRSIRETFRSDTGKRYGPEFIDLGIEIGNRIYDEMECLMRNGRCS